MFKRFFVISVKKLFKLNGPVKRIGYIFLVNFTDIGWSEKCNFLVGSLVKLG